MRKQIKAIKEGQDLQGIIEIVTGCLNDPSTSSIDYSSKINCIVNTISDIVSMNYDDTTFLKTLKTELAKSGVVVRDLENAMCELKKKYNFPETNTLWYN
jgi:hypothetical protein